jgi:hypothetical protein
LSRIALMANVNYASRKENVSILLKMPLGPSVRAQDSATGFCEGAAGQDPHCRTELLRPPTEDPKEGPPVGGDGLDVPACQLGIQCLLEPAILVVYVVVEARDG